MQYPGNQTLCACRQLPLMNTCWQPCTPGVPYVKFMASNYTCAGHRAQGPLTSSQLASLWCALLLLRRTSTSRLWLHTLRLTRYCARA